MQELRKLLFSESVLSKKYILDAGLVAAVVDDNHLYDEEGKAMMNAFKNLGVTAVNWCKTSDIVNSQESASAHVIDCNYESLMSGYMEFDESIQYWDRLLYVDDLTAIVLHTAHEHIIYAGSKSFVNEATQRDNQFRDGWLSVTGNAFSHPELISEYGLKNKNNDEGSA